MDEQDTISITVCPRFTYKPATQIHGVTVLKELTRLEIVGTITDKKEIIRILRTAINEPEKIKTTFNVPEEKRFFVLAAVKTLENGEMKKD